MKVPDKKLIISKEDIARRVRELGDIITKDYADSLSLKIDCIRVASYGMSTKSCGEIRFSKDVELETKGKDILIVEDIVDTGLTLTSLHKYLTVGSPNSIRTCVLINKKERRQVEVVIDYIGFEIKEGFLVGYGLDCREEYRQLGEIYHLLDS